MPVEREPARHDSAEQQRELEALADAARHERETSTPENAADHAERQQESAEAARRVIDRQDREEPGDDQSKAGEQETPATFSQRISHALNYRETMTSIQHKLSPARRNFSQFIHSPQIEKTSEVLEATVLRPSVTLGAVTTALIVGGVFVFIARHYGYGLRGSEILISLVAGGIIGLAIEGIARSLRRR